MTHTISVAVSVNFLQLLSCGVDKSIMFRTLETVSVCICAYVIHVCMCVDVYVYVCTYVRMYVLCK